MIAAMLGVFLVMLLLSLVLLSPIAKETPVIVSYQGPVADETRLEKKEVSQSRAKPSAPASASTRAIAADVASPVSIPVPDIEVTEPTLEFGSGDDFGDGWGSGDGDGFGAGGGTTFFNQKIKAERIVFVIDYSLSMRGEREELMRKELEKSVEGLTPGINFQMIFFAGPAWVAGSEVTVTNNRKKGLVELKGRTFEWTSPGGAHDWKPAGRKVQRADWITCDRTKMERARNTVRKTGLVWGTNWENPLRIALAMDPAPQLIVFMTDGVVDGDMVKLARRIGKEAVAKGTIVNTIAMMEPKAEDGLLALAEATGGEFTVVKKGGKAVRKGSK